MPHILLTQHNDIDTTETLDGVKFNFIAKNRFEDKLSVTVEDKLFLLTKQKKKNNYLIKLDQTTRPSPVSLVKKALASYVKLSKAKILFENIKHNERKVSIDNDYLKDISFFVDSFKTTQDIAIEIGFGSGVHLLYQAQRNPNTIYIGLEIHTPSIEQMLKQVKILNIKNILAINYDARLFLEFMKSNSISTIYVHFPVPWDKKEHRRVISYEFISQSLRTLKKDGTLELRTDSLNYYQYSKKLFSDFKDNRQTILKNKDLDISSKYENRWKKQGKDIWDLILYSNGNSKDIVIDKKFLFDISSDINLNKLKDNLDTKPIVKVDYFIHINQFYTIDNQFAILKIIMGSFNKPLDIYIKIKNNTIDYFINTPIPTTSNHKAHKLLNEILNKALL